MGYTHYWKCTDEPTTEQWVELVEHTRKVFKLCKERGIVLAHEYDEPDSVPIANHREIFFNGEGDDGHKTFVLEPAKIEFAFCKTAQKPYDIAVVAILHLADKFIHGFSWSSDGDPEDHKDGISLANEAIDEKDAKATT
jgi:hypothetical protein